MVATLTTGLLAASAQPSTLHMHLTGTTPTSNSSLSRSPDGLNCFSFNRSPPHVSRDLQAEPGELPQHSPLLLPSYLPSRPQSDPDWPELTYHRDHRPPPLHKSDVRCIESIMANLKGISYSVNHPDVRQILAIFEMRRT